MSNQSSRSRGVWLALAVGAIGVAIAAALLIARQPAPLSTLRITGGPTETSRHLIVQGLARRLTATGLPAQAVAVTGDELEQVDRREVDLALVSAALHAEPHPNVREVAPLHSEALHVLVKPEIAGSVGETLAGLRGRRIDVGPAGSAGAELARAVLVFAGLDSEEAQRAGTIVESLELADLQRMIAAGERDELPDVIFHLATVPSLLAMPLIRKAGFQLAPLPFAPALRLRTLLTQAERGVTGEGRLDLGDVHDAEIPAYMYRTNPPVPPESIPTLGATLLLVAHRDVPVAAIEHVLEIVYGSRFARLAHPPLDRHALAGRPRMLLHKGSRAFLARDEPILSAGDVDNLNNTLGVAGALVGGAIFFWQALRQRRAVRRDRLFAGHMLRVAAIEQRLVDHELASELDLERLIGLQRELLELKRETLGRFARGEIEDHRALAELLAPVDVARDHVAALLLHVRERVAERADAEGKSAAAVWTEEAHGEPEGPPRSG